MSSIEKRTVSLPTEGAAAVERWLLEEVAPAYDALKVDPARGISVPDVFDEIRTRHTAKTKIKA